MIPDLPASLLKVRLLTYCYGEVYEDELSAQAHAIIDTWNRANLTSEQQEAIDELQNIEDNPYPWEYVD